MSEFRKWPKTTTRTIIDFDRLVSRLQLQGDTLICVPVALVDIIRKLLRDRGLWRTTYAKDQDDIGYTIPTEEEFKPIEDMISEFLWETNEMRCQDLISALNGIAASISGCCQNSGPGYISDGEGGFWYGTEAPLPLPDTFGGAGEFESEAAFNVHRCTAANNIISGLILSLNAWSVLSLAGLVAGALIVAFFVTAPPLALFLVLAGAGFSFGAMATLSSYINDNRQSWVCAIYNADSYASMLVEIDTRISDMVIALDIGAFEVPITDLIHGALSTDVFNTAFSVVGLPPVTDGIDCDLCAEAGECQVQFLFDTDDEGFTFTDTSGPDGDATGEYRSDTDALRVVNILPNLANKLSQGRWTKDLSSLGLTPTNDDEIVISFGATSDALSTTKVIVIGYSDASSESNLVSGTAAGTLTLTLAAAIGTIDYVEVICARSTSGSAIGSTSSVDILDVTLNLSNTENCI